MGTQITVLRLHDSVTLEHEFFAEGQHFKEILKEIGVQPGFSRGFWGLEDEDPTVVRVFVNWDPSDCIGNNDLVNTKLKNLKEVKSMEDFHIDFNPSLPTMPLDSNISGNTMVETIYFDKNFPHADGWVSNFKRKVQNILRLRGDVFKAAAGGWATKNTVAPNTSEECLVWFAVVGWPSMQAHLDWRGSPEHLENQKLLEQYKDWWVGIVRVHSSMSEFGRRVSQVGQAVSGNGHRERSRL